MLVSWWLVTVFYVSWREGWARSAQPPGARRPLGAARGWRGRRRQPRQGRLRARGAARRRRRSPPRCRRTRPPSTTRQYCGGAPPAAARVSAARHGPESPPRRLTRHITTDTASHPRCDSCTTTRARWHSGARHVRATIGLLTPYAPLRYLGSARATARSYETVSLCGQCSSHVYVARRSHSEHTTHPEVRSVGLEHLPLRGALRGEGGGERGAGGRGGGGRRSGGRQRRRPQLARSRTVRRPQHG